MEAIYVGTSTQWGHGSGSGPWVMADLENGLFAGATKVYSNNSPVPYDYVTGMVKGKANWFAIKGGNAQNGNMTTMYAGARPTGFTPSYNPMRKQGAIILGIGGDNSNTGIGTFFEGAITSGYPSDTADDSVQANVVAAGYGSSITKLSYRSHNTAPGLPYNVHYNPSMGTVAISYVLPNAGRVSMNIIDQSGRQIATIENGIVSAGRHETVWDARRTPAGIYACRMVIDGRDEWTGKIIVGK